MRAVEDVGEWPEYGMSIGASSQDRIREQKSALGQAGREVCSFRKSLPSHCSRAVIAEDLWDISLDERTVDVTAYFDL